MANSSKKNLYNEKDIRSVIPEVHDPLIEIWAPELKKQKSYWQVGTSLVSRVKISALSEAAAICVRKAAIITGTASENYEPIETLGTTFININKNVRIEAHVTRSRDVAPYVVDGIIGLDVLKKGWDLDRQRRMLSRKSDLVAMSLLPAKYFISDYPKKIRDSLKKSVRSEERGGWASVSRRLEQLRSYLRPDVNDDERPAVIDVLDDYNDCLYLPSDIIQATKLLKYPIKSKANDIFAIPQTEHSQVYWDEIEIIITDLLRQDIIRVSTSPYNSSVGLIDKKPDARGHIDHRLVIGFSELNERSQRETFPIPDIYDAIDELNGSKYFSVLDLASASYHIAIEPQDCRKTAFTTRSGRYEFRRMPPCIKNGAEYMQCLMNKVLEGIRGEQVFVSHDDILVYAPTMEEHEFRIRKVFDRLRAHGLKLRPGKCQMFRSRVLYLGFLITDEGMLPDPEKIEKLQTQPRPQTASDLKSFLGLLSTHKRFLSDYSSLSQPMWDLLKNEKFHWTIEAAESFEKFRTMLKEDLLLHYPDWSRPFVIKTGASKYGIYAGLFQNVPRHSQAQPIAWNSRKYTSAESKLSRDMQISIASTWGTETFRRYVQNTKSLDEVAGLRNMSLRN